MLQNPTFLCETGAVYFAAANTAEGFQSYFDEVFSPDALRRILILKGGPGSGKSTLLHQFLSLCKKQGERAERFLCSADPDSLDAVLLPARGIAVVDGTAPHNREAHYPGAVEELFCADAFWRVEALRRARQEIIEWNQKKRECVQRAGRLLRAAGEIAVEESAICAEQMELEKLRAAAKRFCISFLNGEGGGKREMRQVAAFNRMGLVYLESYVRSAKNNILISDSGGAGLRFLSQVLQFARERDLSFYESKSILEPQFSQSAFFPELSLCLSVLEPEDYLAHFGKPQKTINMQRFQNPALLRAHRSRLRFCQKCRLMLLQAAAENYTAAAASHAELEKLYSENMDFGAQQEAFERAAHRLLGE